MSEDIEDSFKSNEELEFDESDLETVDISDSKLEEDDTSKALAKRHAKKEAKKHLTEQEIKVRKRKRIAIGVGMLFLVIAFLLALPFARWPILNVIGFRGNLQIVVNEKKSHKPVSNATVTLENGTSGTTDVFGRVVLNQVKVGPQTVVIKKTGYGDVSAVVTNKPGTTKLNLEAKVIGIKLDFDFRNWLTSQPIQAAEVKFAKSSAQSDKTGRASLIIEPTEEPKIEVEISAPGYISKKVTTELDVESREISLVAAQKNYFISKRDGKFDIFSSNLDGTDNKKIIEATGKEDEGLLQFTINKNNKQAILVATREGRIQNGKVIAGIYSVDLEKATIKKIDEGSDIQLLDWADNSMIYTRTEAALNYNDPGLTRLMNYNSATARLSEIAQTNYFSVAVLAQSKVFYMFTDPYRSIENATLTSYDITSTTKKTYLAGKQISYATRASYNTIEVQDNAGANYEIQVANGVVKPVDRRPGNNFDFSLSPNSQLAAWSDRRDGQGALIIRNLKNGEEKVSVRSAGLTNPVRFISDDLVVVRVATSQETADYVVSLSTGKLGKIVDVSNINTSSSGGL